ncbi:hypothetical protein E8E15_000651 [Penicillium rubens]|nr:hypothetical protein E8E15_000651 [Penicillium rubens]
MKDADFYCSEGTTGPQTIKAEELGLRPLGSFYRSNDDPSAQETDYEDVAQVFASSNTLGILEYWSLTPRRGACTSLEALLTQQSPAKHGSEGAPFYARGAQGSERAPFYTLGAQGSEGAHSYTRGAQGSEGAPFYARAAEGSEGAPFYARAAQGSEGAPFYTRGAQGSEGAPFYTRGAQGSEGAHSYTLGPQGSEGAPFYARGAQGSEEAHSYITGPVAATAVVTEALKSLVAQLFPARIVVHADYPAR